ncbi:MAG: hypothetical protein ABIH42_10040 [Planctomycetota bacterium]
MPFQESHVEQDFELNVDRSQYNDALRKAGFRSNPGDGDCHAFLGPNQNLIYADIVGVDSPRLRYQRLELADEAGLPPMLESVRKSISAQLTMRLAEAGFRSNPGDGDCHAYMRGNQGLVYGDVIVDEDGTRLHLSGLEQDVQEAIARLSPKEKSKAA